MASHLPLADALAIIPSLPRPLLSRLVARSIERLDEMDGDPDLEDATNAEDEGLTWFAARMSSMDGAGCPIADPGECNGDPEREEGFAGSYGIDQRIAAVGHGYAPWNLDKEAPL